MLFLTQARQTDALNIGLTLTKVPGLEATMAENTVASAHHPAQPTPQEILFPPPDMVSFARTLRAGNTGGRRTVDLGFCAIRQAGPVWLETRRPYLHATTFRDYQKHIRMLASFFGLTKLREITGDDIREYQRWRLARAQGSAINKECSVLQQMLKRIGRWAAIAADFQIVPLPRETSGRAITDDEEQVFFRHALGNRNWCVAAWVSLISVNTSCGSGEILNLRLRDLDLDEGTLRVNAQGAKNRERMRVLPLNEGSLWAARMLHSRATTECGASDPSHFLIPFVIRSGNAVTYDSTRHQTHYYKAWAAIQAAAGVRFHPYCLRHTAITRMLEAGLPEEIVTAMAGHVSRQMLKRYSHIRLEAKRTAVLALQRVLPESVTNAVNAKAGRA